jgi:transposase-like protein
MRAEEFEGFLGKIPLLTAKQLEELEHRVTDLHRGNQSLAVIETVRKSAPCPTCHSPGAVKNGHARGLQRYLCRPCGRTFSKATGSPLSHLRKKNRFIEQGRVMAAGMTLRDAAAEMGVAVSTAFRWRHRFLQSAQTHQGRALSGLLEADETFFRENSKGRHTLKRKARNRGGARMMRSKGKPAEADQVSVLVLRMRGQPYTADHVLPEVSTTEIVNALREMVAPDALLCVDGGGAFRTVEKELMVKVEAVPVYGTTHTRAGPDAVYHVQSVNNYHERLKSWINAELRGVATKYLPNYLAWMRMFEWFKADRNPEYFLLTGLGIQLINTQR